MATAFILHELLLASVVFSAAEIQTTSENNSGRRMHSNPRVFDSVRTTRSAGNNDERNGSLTSMNLDAFVFNAFDIAQQKILEAGELPTAEATDTMVRNYENIHYASTTDESRNHDDDDNDRRESQVGFVFVPSYYVIRSTEMSMMTIWQTADNDD